MGGCEEMHFGITPTSHQTTSILFNLTKEETLVPSTLAALKLQVCSLSSSEAFGQGPVDILRQ